MTAEELVAAFELPGACRVGRRVPKTLWPDPLRGALERAVEELRWIAALKPGNTGIPAGPGIPEVQLLLLRLRSPSKTAASRLHRGVPYPLVVIIEESGDLKLSLTSAECALTDGELVAAWVPALRLGKLERTSLASVYRDWTRAVETLALPGCLAREIARLRTGAAGEKQMSRRVVMNLRLQELQSEFVAAREAILCPSSLSPPKTLRVTPLS